MAMTSDQAPAGFGDAASVPSALNVAEGLYLDSDGSVWPVANWFDEDGDKCPRAAAVTCVAGHSGCWFSLVVADFVNAGDPQ